MWETREVTLTLRLPIDAADQAEAIHKVEPEFLERVVLYGLTRRLIYKGIRDRSVEPIPEAEGRAILDENGGSGAIARW